MNWKIFVIIYINFRDFCSLKMFFARKKILTFKRDFCALSIDKNRQRIGKRGNCWICRIYIENVPIMCCRFRFKELCVFANIEREEWKQKRNVRFSLLLFTLLCLREGGWDGASRGKTAWPLLCSSEHRNTRRGIRWTCANRKNMDNDCGDSLALLFELGTGLTESISSKDLQSAQLSPFEKKFVVLENIAYYLHADGVIRSKDCMGPWGPCNHVPDCTAKGGSTWHADDFTQGKAILCYLFPDLPVDHIFNNRLCPSIQAKIDAQKIKFPEPEPHEKVPYTRTITLTTRKRRHNSLEWDTYVEKFSQPCYYLKDDRNKMLRVAVDEYPDDMTPEEEARILQNSRFAAYQIWFIGHKTVFFKTTHL